MCLPVIKGTFMTLALAYNAQVFAKPVQAVLSTARLVFKDWPIKGTASNRVLQASLFSLRPPALTVYPHVRPAPPPQYQPV